MTQTKLRTIGLLALLGAVAVPVRAQAQDATPPVVPPAKILVLGFYEGNKLDPERRQQVAATIIDQQLGTALQPGLEEKDLSCLKASCLEDLAKQWNEADYIVGGAIFAIPPDKVQYEIQVWLYRVNISPEEKLQGVQRQFSARKVCKADEYPTCLKNEVESLIKGRPVQERLRAAPTGVLTDRTPSKLDGFTVPTAGAKSSCSKWNFARAATLGASAGVMASGLLAGIMVAAQPKNTPPLDFNGQAYSAIGFGAAALALIPGGLALGRPDLFSAGSSSTADGICTSRARSRWSAERGAAVGLFSGLLLSGLVAAIAVSATPSNSCANTEPMGVISCNYSQYIGASWGLTGAWAVGLTLSLAIPSRSTSP